MTVNASNRTTESAQEQNQSSEQNIDSRRKACWKGQTCPWQVSSIYDAWLPTLAQLLTVKESMQHTLLTALLHRKLRYEQKFTKVAGLDGEKTIPMLDLMEARWESNEALCEMTGIKDVRSMKRIIKKLCDKKLLISTGKRGCPERELAFGPVLIKFITGIQPMAKVTKGTPYSAFKKKAPAPTPKSEVVLTTTSDSGSQNPCPVVPRTPLVLRIEESGIVVHGNAPDGAGSQGNDNDQSGVRGIRERLGACFESHRGPWPEIEEALVAVLPAHRDRVEFVGWVEDDVVQHGAHDVAFSVLAVKRFIANWRKAKIGDAG